VILPIASQAGRTEASRRDRFGFHLYRIPRRTVVFRTPGYETAFVPRESVESLASGFHARWQPGFPDEWRGAPSAAARMAERSGAWSQLYVIATGQCNLKCVYCAQSRQDGLGMPAEMMQARVWEFLRASPRPRGIVFYGGEPLLNWPAVRDTIASVRDRGPGLEISLLTNGILMTRDIAGFFAEHRVGAIVSMDGDAASHDRARVDFDGKGRQRAAETGFAVCRDAGCTVGISCVVGEHNAGRIEEVTAYLCGLRPANIGMNLMHSAGRTVFVHSPYEGARAVVRAARTAAEFGIEIEQFARVLRAFVHETPRRADCPACGGRLVVTPEGRYGVCEGAYPYHSEWFFESLEPAERLARSLADWPCSDPDCAGCPGAGMCGGGCPLDALFDRGPGPGRDERACALTGAILETALRCLDELPYDESAPRLLPVEEKRSVLGRFLGTGARPLRTTSHYGEA